MLKFIKEKWKGFVSSWHAGIGKKLSSIFSRDIDDRSFQELEKLLIEADLGVSLSMALVEKVKKETKNNPSLNAEQILSLLKEELSSYFLLPPEKESSVRPHVIMVVGINGSGKTTSLIKLANLYKKEGKKVLIAAADTFRAAAVEQLSIWAEKLGIDIVKSQAKSDPSAVVFDSLQAAKARNHDVVLIDVAGRLHTKTDLMQELKKMRSVCSKLVENAPHETLLVIDATCGQNGIDQAKIFNQYTPISGLILAKLDGTAKGGIAVAIQKEMKLPIRYVGVGEKETDILPFDSKTFIDALLS